MKALEIIKVIGIFSLGTFAGLLIEMARHPKEQSVKMLMMYFLFDIVSIFAGVWEFIKWAFRKPRERHKFNLSLVNNMKATADPYVA